MSEYYKQRFISRLFEALSGMARDAAAQAKMDAPVDTGALRASIASDCRIEGNVIRAEVTAAAPYAAAVELGTSRAPARPYLRPAAKRAWTRGRTGLRYFL